jgi:plasmid maintenance system antidote protein VapI
MVIFLPSTICRTYPPGAVSSGNIVADKTDVSAQRLGKLFGNGPDLCLNMQREYILSCASH